MARGRATQSQGAGLSRRRETSEDRATPPPATGFPVADATVSMSGQAPPETNRPGASVPKFDEPDISNGALLRALWQRQDNLDKTVKELTEGLALLAELRAQEVRG